MINIFRKIRQQLFVEKRFSKYLVYAIGEIALVMIGILLALQVNNWNEERKEYKLEVKLYKSLMESLSADSMDLLRIRRNLDEGIRAQRFLISTPYETLLKDYSAQAIRDSIAQCAKVGSSFFPRFSIYNEITSSGYLALIQSDVIKSELAELYDRRYARYQHIDASIDKKSEMLFEPIIMGDMLIRMNFMGLEESETFDLERFTKHYASFMRECTSIFTTSIYAQNALDRCQEEVNELLALLRAELDKPEP